MTLPAPERGMVLSYAYLWHSEHARGREEGLKDRPCVVVLAVEDKGADGWLVLVAPITHRPPAIAEAAVEIPLPTKRRLGLDEARSWIVVTEGNRFAWPGPDRTYAPSHPGGSITVFCRPPCFNRCGRG